MGKMWKATGRGLVLKYYIDILLEGLIITMENFSHERRCVGWDLNPGLPKMMQVWAPPHSDDTCNGLYTRVGTLIVATIYLQLIQN